MKRLAIYSVLPFVALSLSTANGAAQYTPLPESNQADVGYPHVADALAALQHRSDAQVTADPSGWIIVTQQAPEYTIWSFAPKGHDAYPAVVRRTVKERNGGIFMEMRVLCEAQKAPCDRLVQDFVRLNEQMSAEIQARARQGSTGQR